MFWTLCCLLAAVIVPTDGFRLGEAKNGLSARHDTTLAAHAGVVECLWDLIDWKVPDTIVTSCAVVKAHGCIDMALVGSQNLQASQACCKSCNLTTAGPCNIVDKGKCDVPDRRHVLSDGTVETVTAGPVCEGSPEIFRLTGVTDLTLSPKDFGQKHPYTISAKGSFYLAPLSSVQKDLNAILGMLGDTEMCAVGSAGTDYIITGKAAPGGVPTNKLTNIKSALNTGSLPDGSMLMVDIVTFKCFVVCKVPDPLPIKPVPSAAEIAAYKKSQANTKVKVGDLSSGALSSFDSSKVCAQVDYPLPVKFISVNLAVSAEFKDNGVSDMMDEIELKASLEIGLSIDLLLVTLAVGVKGTVAIKANLPQEVSGPMERMLWVLDLVVHDLLKHSKVGKYFKGGKTDDDNSIYIDQVVKGVKDSIAETNGAIENQVLANTFTEMWHNYVHAMTFRCSPNWMRENYYVTPHFDIQWEMEQVKKVVPVYCNVNCPPSGPLAIGPCAGGGYDASTKESTAKSNAFYDDLIKTEEGGQASTEPRQTGVMRDAAAFAESMASSSPDSAKSVGFWYSNFLLTQFWFVMLGIVDSPLATKDGPIDCETAIGPDVYFSPTIRYHVMPGGGVTTSSVKEAQIRLCSLMASAALVPVGLRANQHSTYYSPLQKQEIEAGNPNVEGYSGAMIEMLNFHNTISLLVPELFPPPSAKKISLQGWVKKAGNFVAGAEILESEGIKGSKVSTFHHMMAMISGSPTQVKASLTKYMEKQEIAKQPAQSCTWGITEIDAKLGFHVSLGSSGASNMCDPGAGGGVTVDVALGLERSLKRQTSEQSPTCDLGKWSSGEKSLTVGAAITDVKLGKNDFDIGLSVAFSDASGLAFSGVDFTMIRSKEPEEPKTETDEGTKEEPKTLKMALKKQIPDTVAGALSDSTDTLIALFNNFANYLVADSSNHHPEVVVSALLTEILHIGYAALGSFIGAVEEFELGRLSDAIGKKSKSRGLSLMSKKVAAFWKKGNHLTSNIIAKVEDSFTKVLTHGAHKLPKSEKKDLAGIGIVAAKVGSQWTFTINMITGTEEDAVISEPLAGGAYNSAKTVTTLFTITV